MLSTVTLLDEVSCHIGGLTEKDLTYLQDCTKQFVDGARETAAFKIGAWNGYESLIKDSGETFTFMLNVAYPILEDLGYEVEINDKRNVLPDDWLKDMIDDQFLTEYGIDLRYYQVESVNEVIIQSRGIIEVATSGGKTLIATCIVKAHDPVKFVTIVPSEKLVNQTYDTFIQCGIDAGKIHGKITGKKREAAWKKDHLVITWQTLKNNRDKLINYNGFIYDETHEMGDVMYNLLSCEMSHMYIRVGMTGTLPKSKYKSEKIKSHIGADVIYNVKAKTLMDEGHISTVDVSLIPLYHEGFTQFADWDDEMKYLTTNKDRIRVIADIISQLPVKNTLILTQAKTGSQIAEVLGHDFIDKDTPSDEREAYYKMFDEEKDYRLVATYGTVGTGISIDDIYQLVIIDVGRSFTRIIQGIGRGCRLDSQGVNHVEVYDIYSRCKFSLKQLTERKKAYREEKYDFEIINPILVNNETD